MNRIVFVFICLIAVVLYTLINAHHIKDENEKSKVVMVNKPKQL